MPFLDPKYEKAAQLRVQRRPKQLAVINQGGCTGCMVCIDFCPVDCIEVVPGPDPDNRNVHKLVEVDLPRCIGCTLCAKYCPWDTTSAPSGPLRPWSMTKEAVALPRRSLTL